jgi:hypothetical protein
MLFLFLTYDEVKHVQSIFHCGVSILNAAKFSHFFVLIILKSIINQQNFAFSHLSIFFISIFFKSKDLLFMYSSSHASGCIETNNHKNSLSHSSFSSIVAGFIFLNSNLDHISALSQSIIENRSTCHDRFDFCFSLANAVIVSILSYAEFLSHKESNAQDFIKASRFFLFTFDISIFIRKSSIVLNLTFSFVRRLIISSIHHFQRFFIHASQNLIFHSQTIVKSSKLSFMSGGSISIHICVHSSTSIAILSAFSLSDVKRAAINCVG